MRSTYSADTFRGLMTLSSVRLKPSMTFLKSPWGLAASARTASLPSNIDQLHRSGVAHHEGRRRVCAGLQRAGSSGSGARFDRGSVGDGSGERQRASKADGGSHRTTVGPTSASDSGGYRLLFGGES